MISLNKLHRPTARSFSGPKSATYVDMSERSINGEITQPIIKVTVPLCEYTEIEGRAFWEASERFDDDEDYPAKKDAFSQTKS